MFDNNNNNRSFFESLVKCYIIWKIICFLARGFAFCIKICYIALKKLIIGAIKVYPILEERYVNFKYNYSTKYRYEINDKFKNFFISLWGMIKKIKDSISKKKLKKQETKNIKTEIKKIEKQGNNPSENKKFKPILGLKKIKYAITNFIYRFEMQILFLSITGIITLGIILGLNFLM